MVQEGGRKTTGGATVVWEDGGTVVGKTSGTSVGSSVLDAPTMGTMYLADPDKLSLVPKRKHRFGINQLGSHNLLISVTQIIWCYTLF